MSTMVAGVHFSDGVLALLFTIPKFTFSAFSVAALLPIAVVLSMLSL
jgi:hypothetical protein